MSCGLFMRNILSERGVCLDCIFRVCFAAARKNVFVLDSVSKDVFVLDSVSKDVLVYGKCL